MMPRNLDRRVEAMLRVTDAAPARTTRRDPEVRLRRRRARLAARSRRQLGEGPGTRRPRRAGRDAGARARADRRRERRHLIAAWPSPCTGAWRTSSVRPSRPPSPGSTPTSPRCGPSATPKRCTRRVSRPAASAPISGRCTTSSTRTGRCTCARSSAGSAPSSAACATSKCCGERLRGHAALLPDTDADGGARARSAGSTPITPRRAPNCSDRSAEPRYAQLHRALHDAVTGPRLTTAAGHARQPTRYPAPCVRRGASCAARSTRSAPVPSDASLHQVRIRAKRCRYAAELAGPVIGRAGPRPRGGNGAAPGRAGRAPGLRGRRRLAGQDRARVQPAGGVRARACSPRSNAGSRVRARAAFEPAWEAARTPSLRAWL